jgi:hypothetical protein
MVGFEALSPWVSWVVVVAKNNAMDFVTGYAPTETGTQAEHDGFYADLSQALRAARAAVGFQTVQVVGSFNVNLGADLGGTVEGGGSQGAMFTAGWQSALCSVSDILRERDLVCTAELRAPGSIERGEQLGHLGMPSRPHLKDFVLVLVVDHRAGRVRSCRTAA